MTEWWGKWKTKEHHGLVHVEDPPTVSAESGEGRTRRPTTPRPLPRGPGLLSPEGRTNRGWGVGDVLYGVGEEAPVGVAQVPSVRSDGGVATEAGATVVWGF